MGVLISGHKLPVTYYGEISIEHILNSEFDVDHDFEVKNGSFQSLMATPAAPLSPSTGTTLSAQYVKHDSKSTHVLDCCAKRPALRSQELLRHTAEQIGRSADHGQQLRETLARSS